MMKSGIGILIGVVVGIAIGFGMGRLTVGDPAGGDVLERGAVDRETANETAKPGNAGEEPASPEGPTERENQPIGKPQQLAKDHPCPPCPAGDGGRATPGQPSACGKEIAENKALTQQLEQAQAKVSELTQKVKGQPTYDAPTAKGRRTQAAQAEHLLLEMPNWRDEYALPDSAVEKHGLTKADQQWLEDNYTAYQESLQGELQKIYGDLMGDPAAGESSTLNALIHNILQQSPQDPCRQRTLVLIEAMKNNLPLPEPPADMLPCEAAMRLVIQTVDDLEQQARETLGDTKAKALWNGTSSMEFSTSSK